MNNLKSVLAATISAILTIGGKKFGHETIGLFGIIFLGMWVLGSFIHDFVKTK